MEMKDIITRDKDILDFPVRKWSRLFDDLEREFGQGLLSLPVGRSLSSQAYMPMDIKVCAWMENPYYKAVTSAMRNTTGER
jgi:hypothetical protein